MIDGWNYKAIDFIYPDTLKSFYKAMCLGAKVITCIFR